jgi:hypothetical protein
MNYIINEQKRKIYDIISYVHWTFQLPRYIKHDIHITQTTTKFKKHDHGQHKRMQL